MVVCVLVCSAAAVHGEADPLGFPTPEAKSAGAIQIPFQMEMAQKTGDPAKLVQHSAGSKLLQVVFHVGGRGETLDLGQIDFPKSGMHRVYLKSGVGQAVGVAPYSNVFHLEMDGQPAAVHDAKGTGGLGKVQWFDIGRIVIGQPGPHHLTWRNQPGRQVRQSQIGFGGLVLVPERAKASEAARKEQVRISKDGWIRSWLLAGPFGTGGVTSIAPHYQQHMLPISGTQWTQIWLNTPITVTWKEYVSPEDRIDFNLPETFADRPDMPWPPGILGSAYAHLYLRFPLQQDVLLDFESSVNAELFLDGEPIAPDKTITIQAGINRFLVKLYFPQCPRKEWEKHPVWFKCRFKRISGEPLEGFVMGGTHAQPEGRQAIEYRTDTTGLYLADEPARRMRGRRLGDLIRLTFDDTAHPWHVYLTGEPVGLEAQLSLLGPWERLREFGFNDSAYDNDAQPVQVNWTLYDFDGGVAGRGRVVCEVGLEVPGKMVLDLGRLPRGHYTLYCQLRRGLKLLSQPQPTMITVLDEPSLPQEGVHSKFAHSFYYALMGSEEADNRNIRLLTLAKVRLNVGSVFKWWMGGDPNQWLALPPEQRAWPRAPRIESIEKARKLGLEFTGQLGAYSWLASRSTRYKDKLPGDHVILQQDLYDGGSIEGKEFEKLLDTYVYETVKKYKDCYRYWRIDNEMNLLGWSPEEYVRLHELTAKALKRADPEAKMWSGSLSGFPTGYISGLLELGIDEHVDVLDFHSYFWPNSDWATGGMHHRLSIFPKNNVSLPLADGEFGCYRSLFQDGARTQAAMYSHALTIVHTQPWGQVRWIAPTFITSLDYTTDAGKRGQYPAYLAYRTAADFLEGAEPEGSLNLGGGIAAYRFRRPDGGQVIVLWDIRNRKVRIPDLNKTWKAYDMLGRPVAWSAEDELPLSIFPVYCVESRR